MADFLLAYGFRFTSIWWIGRFLPNLCSRLVPGLLAIPGNSRIVRKIGLDLLSRRKFLVNSPFHQIFLRFCLILFLIV